MKKWTMAAGLCAVLFAACEKDEENKVNDTDRNFVNMASISNNAEIMAGQLAATKGNNAGVKAFGQQMVNEHTLAKDDLRNRANSAGLSIHDSVDAEHRTLMTRLSSLSGYSFDTAYMNSQVNDHSKTVNLFNTEISSGSHQSIRSYASDYLPNIQMHFNKADSLRRKL